MTDKLPDVWASRDFPVLRAVALAIDEGRRPNMDELGTASGLGPEDVERAIRALERRQLLTIQWTAQGPLWVKDVSGEAYLITGLHPDGSDALETLVQMLHQAAERTPDPEEKGRLRRAAGALGDVAGQVGAGIMTAYLAQMGGLG